MTTKNERKREKQQFRRYYELKKLWTIILHVHMAAYNIHMCVCTIIDYMASNIEKYVLNLVATFFFVHFSTFFFFICCCCCWCLLIYIHILFLINALFNYSWSSFVSVSTLFLSTRLLLLLLLMLCFVEIWNWFLVVILEGG